MAGQVERLWRRGLREVVGSTGQPAVASSRNVLVMTSPS